MLYKPSLFALFLILLVPISSVYGHGLGIDTISSIDVQEKELSISIELPIYFDNTKSKQLTITAVDEETKDNAKNITFLIGLFHEGEMIFRNYFFAEDGYLPISIKSTQDNDVTILGQQDSLLGAWHATESQPIEIVGPVFESGGLYSFEVEIRTIDEPTNIIEDAGIYYADLSVVETTSYQEKDSQDQDVEFRMKSYFDKISDFQYDPELKQVTFYMPFDWSEKQVSHIPVVHEEVHFPKGFEEFLSPSYTGYVNNIELFKSSIQIDDYTEDNERIVHFVLLQDHLRFIKNQMKSSDMPLPDNIVFTLTPNDAVEFPINAYTKNEEFRVDLSWDPIEIQPEQETKFVFTIRDGVTGEPLRNSDYDFVIIQNGKEIHRTSGTATVGGAFEDYVFSEEQTGPTIIRFENIRDSGQDTEFGIVVAPEFGHIVILILVSAITVVIILSRNSKLILQRY